MKNTFFFFLLLFATANVSFPTTYTITNSGFTFTPSSITINLGDTVNFVVSSMHYPREVSEATWNADGNTSNGGFDLPAGGGIVVLTQTGVHYYVCVPHAFLGMKGTITVNPATDVKSINETAPNNFILMQNYPNPFNPSTIISYVLPSESRISLKIYNLSGQKIAEIVNNTESAGYHEVNYKAKNLASGVYFYRLSAYSINGNKKFEDTKKLILLK